MKIILELEPNEILSNITAFSDFLSHFGNESEVLPKVNTKCLKTEENDVIKPVPLRIDEVERLEEFQKKIWLSLTEKQQKSKGKTKEERVTELKKYANSKWKSLTDAQKKSMKSFVEFYEKKIMEQNFTINYEKQFTQWWQNDKNNR